MARYNRKHFGCKVEKCKKKHEGLGYCKIHYLRYYKYGNPLGKGNGRKKQGKYIKCLMCDKEKYYISSLVNNRKHYCSKKCYAKSLIGKHQSPETILKRKQYILDKSPSWQGGRTKTPEGYILIKMPTHPNAKSNGYVYEHRIIMETKIGRRLKSEEHIHHKNNIKDDNHSNNLIMLSNREHKLLHCRKSTNRMGKFLHL